jgi:hypothetical protein
MNSPYIIFKKEKEDLLAFINKYKNMVKVKYATDFRGRRGKRDGTEEGMEDTKIWKRWKEVEKGAREEGMEERRRWKRGYEGREEG